MYIESIVYQKEEKGEWLKGWYVGETDNCKNSVFLDENYQPLQRDIDGCQVWNYRTDVEKFVQFRCND